MRRRIVLPVLRLPRLHQFGGPRLVGQAAFYSPADIAEHRRHCDFRSAHHGLSAALAVIPPQPGKIGLAVGSSRRRGVEIRRSVGVLRNSGGRVVQPLPGSSHCDQREPWPSFHKSPRRQACHSRAPAAREGGTTTPENLRAPRRLVGPGFQPAAGLCPAFAAALLLVAQGCASAHSMVVSLPCLMTVESLPCVTTPVLRNLVLRKSSFSRAPWTC